MTSDEVRAVIAKELAEDHSSYVNPPKVSHFREGEAPSEPCKELRRSLALPEKRHLRRVRVSEYPHGVDLDRCLVQPRRVECQDTFPWLEDSQPLPLWIVLEETPEEKGGYLIVFDDREGTFGLAIWAGDTPVVIGYYGSFLNTLRGM